MSADQTYSSSESDVHQHQRQCNNITELELKQHLGRKEIKPSEAAVESSAGDGNKTAMISIGKATPESAVVASTVANKSATPARSPNIHTRVASGDTIVPAVPPNTPQNFTASSQQSRDPQMYMQQLLEDKEKLRRLGPNYFKHVEHIVDNVLHGMNKKPNVEANATPPLLLAKDVQKQPKPDRVTLSKRILVPVDEYPNYNFVGRILGPRGMTAKLLEEETGCRIMVRGRGSCRQGYRRSAGSNSGSAVPPTQKPTEENGTIDGANGNEDGVSSPKQEAGTTTEVAEPLHVVIECENVREVAEELLAKAVDKVETLLHPPPEGKDELKRKQLIELSIINGTYRPTTATRNALQTPRMGGGVGSVGQPMPLLSSLGGYTDFFKPPPTPGLVDVNLNDVYAPQNNMFINQQLVDQFYRNYMAMFASDPVLMAQFQLNTTPSADLLRMVNPNGGLEAPLPTMPAGGPGSLVPPPSLHHAHENTFFSGPIPPGSYEEYALAASMLQSPPYCRTTAAGDASVNAPKQQQVTTPGGGHHYPNNNSNAQHQNNTGAYVHPATRRLLHH